LDSSRISRTRDAISSIVSAMPIHHLNLDIPMVYSLYHSAGLISSIIRR
jgi:hypothetical protein